MRPIDQYEKLRPTPADGNRPAIEWRLQAACRNRDPELFFPVGTTGPALAVTVAAQLICQSCSVSADCLEWALRHGADDGIWGGHTADDRRLLRRRMRSARRATPGPPVAEPAGDETATRGRPGEP